MLALALSAALVAVVRIRRPGTGFAKTVRLGANSHDYHVAAAPGGWSAAAWVSPIPPVAKSGAFSFGIPVACDEACDLRIDVGSTRPDLRGYDLRELSLPAGGHAPVRISPSANDERRFVKAERPTQMHILVQAADRAGNLAKAEVTARVQRR